MTEKETLAYIAGIVDGEGYVGIKKSTWGMRNRDDVYCPTYSERVQIRMNCREVLEVIRKRFGGSLSTEPRLYPSVSGFTPTKIMSIYRATDRVAATMLKAIRPYLIEKAPQTEAVLKLRRNKDSKASRKHGGPTGRRLSDDILAEREKLYLAIREMHKRRT